MAQLLGIRDKSKFLVDLIKNRFTKSGEKIFPSFLKANRSIATNIFYGHF